VPSLLRHCSRCTTSLSRDVTEGLCPACLLEAAISGSGDGDHDDARPLDACAPGVAAYPQRFGDYELLGEIARGGQGVVYHARHYTLRREVALKMLPQHPWSNPVERQRFHTEARAAAELDHPGIVPVFDVGEVNGQPFFTMKRIDGVALDRLRREAALTPERCAALVVEIARALQHAHDRGVLHRDLKPGNILLDAAGHAHVTDFGLAKLVAADNALTRTRELLGTPSYLSPEAAQGGGRALSTATDIYGLGAVLYYLLTGTPPFAGATALETIRDVIASEPRPPRALNTRVDRDLETICLKCLAKEPARRYATAGLLADDLERWLRREPIHARPSSLAYRGAKWFRRNAVAAAVTAALLLGAAAVGWSIRYAGTAPAHHGLAIVLRAADAESRRSPRSFLAT
jgi:serine/threonine protein kinase